MNKSLKILGLAKCSTCKNAKAQLEEHGWTVAFHDVQQQPLSGAERADLVAQFGDKIINRASLTWRGMSEDERTADPVEMMGDKPSVMKRPAIIAGDLHLLGWTANVKRALDVPA
ncbi:arsenate reductase family protein [Paracoccus sp. SM22M-07]|uniref:arsenate reductase family protein n=1 Tax=Paracoccus sp. SM22M-07 TaxID=1520813 RepID=UPI00091A9C94|nr:ArsC/Spx/MgsR family protein [Paracoccus sp. SM22M-07]OJH45281.1 arsenate reductase [Paracoccus sp. SM22M-07]